MRHRGRFPLFALLPCAAVLCACRASVPALDIWSHVAMGTEYDPWRDESTVRAMPVALAWGGSAAALALLSMWVKDYRGVALGVLVWAVLAVALVPLGMRGVRIQPDGQVLLPFSTDSQAGTS